jgi:hypothetical protein
LVPNNGQHLLSFIEGINPAGRGFENSDCVYRLTIEGKEAAKNGIKKYIESIEQEKKLDTDVKTASIKSSKLSKLAIIISIIAVLASFVVPFLVVNYEQHIKNINTTGK